MFWLNVFMSTKRIPGAPEPEEDIRSLGTEITGSCQPSCESWELNPGPPQEEQPPRHLPAPIIYFLFSHVCSLSHSQHFPPQYYCRYG